MSKKKLLMILGSGSSLENHMPSVDQLDSLLTSRSHEWAKSSHAPNHFIEAWNSLRSYFEADPSAPKRTPNFELTIRQMMSFAHWLSPLPLAIRCGSWWEMTLHGTPSDQFLQARALGPPSAWRMRSRIYSIALRNICESAAEIGTTRRSISKDTVS